MTGTEQSAAGWREGGPCSCAFREIDCGVKPRNALGPRVWGHYSALREYAWRQINEKNHRLAILQPRARL